MRSGSSREKMSSMKIAMRSARCAIYEQESLKCVPSETDPLKRTPNKSEAITLNKYKICNLLIRDRKCIDHTDVSYVS